MLWVGGDPTQPTLKVFLVEGLLHTRHVTPGPVGPTLVGWNLLSPFLIQRTGTKGCSVTCVRLHG